MALKWALGSHSTVISFIGAAPQIPPLKYAPRHKNKIMISKLSVIIARYLRSKTMNGESVIFRFSKKRFVQ